MGYATIPAESRARDGILAVRCRWVPDRLLVTMQRCPRLLLLLLIAAPTTLHAVDFTQLDACTLEGPGVFCYWAEAVVSPDAQWFAFTDETSYSPHWEYYPKVQVRSRDGSVSYAVGTFGGEWSHSPAWSPDGKRLAFVGSWDWNHTKGGLWVVELANRSNEQAYQLLTDQDGIDNPRWSLDGNFLAYERGGQGIWMISRWGGAPNQIIPDGKSPIWGPDGDMAFERAGDLWIRSSAGETRRLKETPHDELQPAWSPTGEWIAYSSDQSGNWDIWVIAPTGGTPVQVTHNMLMATAPSWSADGASLSFMTLHGPDTIWLATDLPDFTTTVAQRPWGHVKSLYR